MFDFFSRFDLGGLDDSRFLLGWRFDLRRLELGFRRGYVDIVLPTKRSPKVLDAAPNCIAERRDFSGPEDDEYNNQNEDEFADPGRRECLENNGSFAAQHEAGL